MPNRARVKKISSLKNGFIMKQKKHSVLSTAQLAMTVLMTALVFCTISAQSNLFQTGSWSVSSLNHDQLLRYNKATALAPSDQIYPITIGDLGHSQEGGRIKAVLPGTSCGELVFRAKYSEYQSETDYVWYAEIETGGSTDCLDGYLYIRSMDGKRLGEVRVEENYYMIEDFGGVNALVKAPPPAEPEVCGGAILPDEDLNGDEEEGVQERSNWNCNVRVLVLYTPSAGNRVNNIEGRAASAIDITNQAFRNSGIASSQLTLILAAVEEIGIDETDRTVTNTLLQVAANPIARSRRDIHEADLVILLVDKSIMQSEDNAAGAAFLGPSNNFAYGVSRVLNINNGFVFSHEIGHLFGANHEPCSAVDAGENCLSSSGGILFQRAHTWEFKRKCGFLGLSKCLVKRKTIMFSESASNPDVIPHFSNPAVRVENRATGIVGERDNSRQLANTACTVANFRGGSEQLEIGILGESFVYVIDTEWLGVMVSGAPGPYQYEWRTSLDGVNWTVASTSQNLEIRGEDYEAGDIIYVSVTVIAGGGQTATVWHVVVVLDNGQDHWRPANISDEISFKENIMIYPNPASESVQVRYSLNADSEIAIKLVDLSGKALETYRMKRQRGENTEEISLSGLPPGVYILRFTGEYQSIGTVIVKK